MYARVIVPRSTICASCKFTLSSLSQAHPLGYLPSPQCAFQGHAAHALERSRRLGPTTQGEWVGTGRVALRYVSPCPPLDPYVRLSPHTAHDRGILRERSISPAPRCIPHGQLCAFAGYLCTVSRPSPSGPSPCARFSRTRTTMPYLTACRDSEVLDRVSPTYFHPPSHPLQALPCSQQRTQTRWFRWRVIECPIRALRLPSPMQGTSG